MTRRWALVTGAGRRIGTVIAERLAAEGWNLVLHANQSHEAAAELAGTLARAHGIETTVEQQDLADLDQLASFAERVAGRAGEVHLLVNNASIFPFDDIATVTGELLEHCYRVNCAAPVLLSRHYAERLRPAADGAIVNIIDTKVTRPDGHFLSYELSKGALAQATRGLARALAPEVRVNAVAPGLVLPSGRQSQADFERVHAETPLRRGVEPVEVADAVLYLATAPTVTGQTVAVDAGQGLAGEDAAAYGGMS
jgi:NAD(P)-dependent dehydrogenase (short-subunit alcohol dehydrogenase family)